MDGRLAAVADSLVRRPRRRALVVLVAGNGDASGPGETAGGLRRAARRLGIPIQAPTPRGPTPAGEAAAAVLLANLGPLAEKELAFLSPPTAATPVDLLLWTLPPDDGVSLRSLYILSVCVWSFRPRRVRCILAPGGNRRQEARERVVWGLRRTGQDEAVEVLTRPADWGEPSTEALLDQILLSALAAGAGS